MLTGKRLRIRRIEEYDIDIIHRWYQDEDFMMFYTPEELLTTYSQLKDFLARSVSTYPESSQRIDFFLENKRGQAIGLADLTAISHRSQHATFSMGIDKGYRNHGYGPEALVLIHNFAYRELNLVKVSGHIYKENEKVIRQVKRLGVQQEGILRKESFFKGEFHDIVYLSIFKEEFYQNDVVRKLLKYFGCY